MGLLPQALGKCAQFCRLMTVHYEVLPNGTEVLIAEDHRVSCAALQVWVRVGSLCEQDKQHGMAHFIEHMLFKGTKTSEVGELWHKVEGWGGDINAYTDYDRTVYHLTVNAAYTLDGLTALHDAIYHSELNAQEIAKEKEVVCEEIRHYRDDPSDRIYEEARQLAFGGQVHPILGDSADAVRAFDPESLHAFYRAHYVPCNIAVTAVGAFDQMTVRVKIFQLFGSAPDKPAPRVEMRALSFAAGVQSTVLRGDYRKPRLLVALPAPCQHDVDTFMLDCATFVLGSGDAARLNLKLRDELRLASAISCANMAFSRGGMFEIATLTEVNSIPALVTAMVKEIQRLLHLHPITPAELERAKANAKVDFALQNETAAGRADSLAHGLTTPWKYLFSSCFTTLLEEISPELVRQALARWLNFKQAVIVCAVDEDAHIDADTLTESFRQACATTSTKRTTTSYPIHKPDTARQVLQLRAGVRLIHQPSKSELFNLIAVTHGGVALENNSNNGVHNASAALLGQANASYDHRRLTLAVEGRGAALSGFSETNSIGLHLQCLQQDAAYFGKIFATCLLKARFPASRWQTIAAEIADSITLQKEDPFAFCMQQYRAAMFADHPYGMSPLGTAPQKFDPDMLLQHWHDCCQRGAWVFAASTAMATKKLHAMLDEALADFAPPPCVPTIAELPELNSDHEHCYPKAREQSHIIYGLRGLAWQDPQRATLDVLIKVKAQRLFDTLRERQGLVYSITPILTFAIGAGTLGIYTACAPDKAARAIKAIAAELRQGKPPTAAEIERAQQFLAGNWNTEMSRGERQVMHVARMELFGVGHANLDIYPQKVRKVSATDIAALSARLLADQPHVCIKVG